MKSFVIASAYSWSDANQKKAIKYMVDNILNRFNGKKHKNGIEFSINYKRLRSSAGKTMLDSIIKRIEEADVILFNITPDERGVINANTLLELGIALSTTRQENTVKDQRLFLIREKGNKKGNQSKVKKLNKENYDHFLKGVPSDLQGYFISEYNFEKGKTEFNDSNSLRASIEGCIKEFYNNMGNEKNEIIDETDL